MMTRTSLSAAALQRREGPPWPATRAQKDNSAQHLTPQLQPVAGSERRRTPKHGRLRRPLPLVYPKARRAQPHPRKPLMLCVIGANTGTRSRPSPLASAHPRKPLLATSHLPLATAFLIYGSAIKAPRKPFENSNLRISNRRQTGGMRDAGSLESHSGVESADLERLYRKKEATPHAHATL